MTITLTVHASDRLVTFPGGYDYGNPFKLPSVLSGISGTLGAYTIERKIAVDVREYYWYQYWSQSAGRWLPCEDPYGHGAVDWEQTTTSYEYFYYPALATTIFPFNGYACSVSEAQKAVDNAITARYGEQNRTEYDLRYFDVDLGDDVWSTHRENKDVSWGWSDMGNSGFDKL
jgi:hypothetical protein